MLRLELFGKLICLLMLSEGYLARVQTLRSNKQLLVLLVLDWVTEVDLQTQATSAACVSLKQYGAFLHVLSSLLGVMLMC